MGVQTFQLLREYPVADGRSAWEALSADGARVTIWPGLPSLIPVGIHPLLPAAIGSGEMDGGPVWIEHRPGRHLLADIRSTSSQSDGLLWTAQVADALAALHTHGRFHGSIDASVVVLNDGATPFLIGAGRQNGSEEQDIAAVIALLSSLSVECSDLAGLDSAAALGARIREIAVHTDEQTPVQLPVRPDPTPVRTEAVLLIPLGPTDEVQHDIGADATGKGLLDRWANTDAGDDLTEDPTESVDRSIMHINSRQPLLAALEHHMGEAISKLDDNGIAPSAEFREMILSEAPDPLPIPEGLPHGRLHNPEGEAERTAEVTGTNTIGEAQSTEETTSITHTGSVQPPLLIGLLTATVLGMVGAAIMLGLVWLTIGGVF
jgi:hypothetical protein